MSGPIVNNLRRQIEDTRPKGGMAVGHPKATVIIADLEGLIARHEALERQLEEVRGERDAADDLLQSLELTYRALREEHDTLRQSLDNCFMVARRELWRASRGKVINPVCLESIVRFCESAGLKSSPLRSECGTCDGDGSVHVGFSGSAEDGNAPEFERCPECGYGDKPLTASGGCKDESHTAGCLSRQVYSDGKKECEQ
jgi:hypothetical protein